MSTHNEVTRHTHDAPVVSARRFDEDIDVREIIVLLWRSWVWPVGFAVFFGGLAAYHAYTSVPVYHAEALLAVRSGELSGPAGVLQGQLGGLASLVGLGSGSGNGRRQEFVAFLKSRALARAFIEREQLMQVFYASRWDAQTHESKVTPGKRAPAIGDAVDYLTNLRTIDEDARTGLLKIAFDWTDPGVAAKWANDYVALANEQLRAEAIGDGQKSIEFLNQELGKTTLEPVRQSLYRLMEGRLNQVMLANIEREFAFRAIDAAEVPEPDKFIRPRRRMEIALGIVFGLVVGTVLVLWRHVRASVVPAR